MTRITPDQRAAANPEVSAWVAANAGTGKTSVLVDRVTRLLLERDARPASILCLTFTKAAAAEMDTRLYRRLGKWTVLPERELAERLTDLLGRRPAPGDLAKARRLFAKALDAPGRVRIQTIHAFCESILKRFALEARVPPHFAIADERTASELIAEARERLLERAARPGPLQDALGFIVGAIDEAGFDRLLAELVRERRKLKRLLTEVGDDVAAAAEAVRATLGVRADETPERALADFAAATPDAELRRAATALDTGSAADQDRAAAIRAWLANPDRSDRFEAWADIFVTDKGNARKNLITIAAQKAYPAALDILRKEQERVLAALARRNTLHVAAASTALLTAGAALVAEYEAEKRARALLDYDDLILKTSALLRTPGVAPWVLYKLDGGLDHMLVDEAQDTSPEQWEVIAALTEEFFSGSGAKAGARTVFAVGDEKQSIFSFQGTDPEAFERMKRRFAARVPQAGEIWRPVDLHISFRSTEAVLAAVDRVFAQAAARAGVVSGTGGIRHTPHRLGQAGLVELWPPVEKEETEESAPWDAPLDYVDRSSPPAVLAGRIAGLIRGWLRNGERLESQDRPIRPGDVMILVRKRDRFFEEMVRALKAADVPVAGADRLVLAEHIAVMDLVALGDFALLPDDDLTLATVLKGPLFGLDDDSLFDLCWRRQGRLWAVLKARAGERPEWQSAVGELAALLDKADVIRPYEFFGELMGARRGRKRMLRRLGPEAADPLDEFLALTLAYERQHAPSLQGFLHWFRAGAAEIKRDLEQARNEVRVLTVHGAKGLEAPIVFLPDTCSAPDGRQDPPLFWRNPGDRQRLHLPLWPVARDRDDPTTAALRDGAKAAREREYRRLLYVALTRARDRLYIGGWQSGAKRPEGCWYDLIAPALKQSEGAKEIRLPTGETVWRLQSVQAKPPERPAEAAAVHSAEPLPAWARQPAPSEPSPSRPLAPSRPEGDEPAVTSPLGPDRGLRFRRGLLVHRLLELLPELPPEARHEGAIRLLSRLAPKHSAAAQSALADEVLAVLESPEFAVLFGPGSRAEAPLAGQIGDLVIAGQVDRLVVTRDEVLVVDFKTNRPAPATPDQVDPLYLRQMAEYRALLRSIFPGRTVRCALLWTDGPRLMTMPELTLDLFDPSAKIPSP